MNRLKRLRAWWRALCALGQEPYLPGPEEVHAFRDRLMELRASVATAPNPEQRCREVIAEMWSEYWSLHRRPAQFTRLRGARVGRAAP